MILISPRRLVALSLLATLFAAAACSTDGARASGVEGAAAAADAAPAFDPADAVAWTLRTADGHYLLTVQRDESNDYRRPGPALRGSLLHLADGRAEVDLLLTDADGKGEWTSGESGVFRQIRLSGVPGWATDAAPGAQVSGRIDGEALSFGVSPLALAILTRERNTVNVDYGDSIKGEYRFDLVQVPADQAAAGELNKAMWANLQPGRSVGPRDAAATLDDSLDTWVAAHDDMLTGLTGRPPLERFQGSSYSETLIRSQRIVAADDTLLAVATLDYSFTDGAAHSTYETRFRSVDRRTGEAHAMKAADLPSANRQRLQRALDAAAYRFMTGNEMDADADLTRYYNAAHIPITNNAARVPGGWLFGYAPYEIMSGATSDIDLVVWDRDWR